jgi:hypothetical protein
MMKWKGKKSRRKERGREKGMEVSGSEERVDDEERR